MALDVTTRVFGEGSRLTGQQGVVEMPPETPCDSVPLPPLSGNRQLRLGSVRVGQGKLGEAVGLLRSSLLVSEMCCRGRSRRGCCGSIANLTLGKRRIVWEKGF